ncbi:hypothetical protein KI387_006914 [Taxus chinensis]|uniref:Chitin-binding type-1 domain-containing protein n=1 Tax=Taxus chinensis TaxID=29808 RepID=A0AA38LJZ6_TAXCH|nr:hypothetical protein KI387_006914 [Taxus chinensis]
MDAKMWIIMAFICIIIGTAPKAVFAEDCGSQAGGALCAGGFCCSQYGWCGDTPEHCGAGCQSQCTQSPSSGSGSGVASIITETVFNEMLKHRNEASCPAKNFYTYNAFIQAAGSFPGFGTTGDAAAQKKELAAFLAQTSHETTGGWETAPDGPYAWGYCFVIENGGGDYCDPKSPCASGQQYYGRGPIQLTWNYNYIAAGNQVGFDGLNKPDTVATDPAVSFKTAIWFWMTAQSPKPSCHDVITGRWQPTSDDVSAGRVAGYGMTTNVINGGLECGKGTDAKVEDRIGFYKRYSDILGVSDGSNIDTYNMKPYA